MWTAINSMTLTRMTVMISTNNSTNPWDSLSTEEYENTSDTVEKLIISNNAHVDQDGLRLSNRCEKSIHWIYITSND